MNNNNDFDSVYNLYIKNKELGNNFLFRDKIHDFFSCYKVINRELDLSMFDFSFLCNIERFLIGIDFEMYQFMKEKYETERKERVNQFFNSINIDEII